MNPLDSKARDPISSSYTDASGDSSPLRSDEN
jgi:hypothetical protein